MCWALLADRKTAEVIWQSQLIEVLQVASDPRSMPQETVWLSTNMRPCASTARRQGFNSYSRLRGTLQGIERKHVVKQMWASLDYTRDYLQVPDSPENRQKPGTHAIPGGYGCWHGCL